MLIWGPGGRRNGAELDEHSEYGGLTASSMVSDFMTDMSRKIAWHTGPNPCMAVYCNPPSQNHHWYRPHLMAGVNGL